MRKQRGGSRIAVVLGAAAMMVMAMSGLAQAVAGYTTSLEITLIVRAPEGSISPLAVNEVPEEFHGQTCTVVVDGNNQNSVHPDNNFIVESGDSTVVVPDIEREPNEITQGIGTLTLGPTILLSLEMGPDEVFSGGHLMTIECEPIPEPGQIIVVKEVTDGSDTSQSFEFTASYDGDGFALADGESNNSGDLDAGTYTVSETVPDGWNMQSAVCDDESPVDAIDLQAGETVTCTFTNHEVPPEPEPGQIIVVKEVTEGSDTSQSFEFTASYDGDGFALADGETNNSGDLDAGTYSVAESGLEGWSLLSATCDDGSSVDEIGLEEGEIVTCTFTNLQDEVLASIVVTVGAVCEDVDHGVITVGTSVDGGATVVVSDSNGQVVGTFTGDGEVIVPDDATYTWTATPNEGFEFPPGSPTSGTVTVEDCIETLPFTGIETPIFAALASVLIGLGSSKTTSSTYRAEQRKAPGLTSPGLSHGLHPSRHISRPSHRTRWKTGP